MHIISLCRNIFDYVFIVSTIAYVVMSFREYVPKEENEIKVKSDVTKEEKVYDIIQIIIIVAALAIFLVGVIYGVSNKKFLWLFILVGVPAYLEKIASAFVSISIVGDVVKTNDEGTLTFREHTAIFLISSVVLILQTVKCFEHSKDFVMGYCGSIIADLLLLLMYVVILFVYIFLTCSLIPILMLFGTRILNKIAGYVPGKGTLKKCGNFFTERIEKSIKQSQLTITFLKKVKGRNVFVKILCMPIIIVAIIMDIVIFLFNVVCSFVISSIGYIVIICRILKRACKKVINAIFKLSDKKIVAVSFRIAIIAALVITVIINRYDVFVKNVEESTAVLEFVASSIIIPVVFEWINSGRKSTEIEKIVRDNKMSQKPTYPNIDMQRTGRKLKHMIESAGYTPRIIQDYLHLSCVQPIYRWYKGKILPSVDHLLMLSELLNVHMEDLLVKKNAVLVLYDIEQCYAQAAQKRFIAYCKKIYQSVA